MPYLSVLNWIGCLLAVCRIRATWRNGWYSIDLVGKHNVEQGRNVERIMVRVRFYEVPIYLSSDKIYKLCRRLQVGIFSDAEVNS